MSENQRVHARVTQRLLLLFALAFTGTLAFRISMPAIAFHVRSVLEASAFGVGLLTAVFFAARATFAVIAGRIYDKYGSRASIVATVCFALNAVAAYSYLLGDSLAWMLLVRGVQGALNGLAWVLVQAMLGDAAEESFRGRAFSIYFTCGSLGIMAGNALYAMLASKPLTIVLGVSSLFFCVSALLAFAAGRKTGVARRSREIVKGEARSRSGGRARIVMGATLLLLAIVLGTAMYNSIAKGDLVYVLFKEIHGIQRSTVAWIISVSTLASMLAGYLISWVSDRISTLWALRMSATISLAGCLLMSTGSLPVSAIGLAFFYAGTSGILPVTRRIATTYYKMKGTVLGLVNAAGNIGNIAGSMIAGCLYDAMGAEMLILGGVGIVKTEALMSIMVAMSTIASFLLRSLPREKRG